MPLLLVTKVTSQKFLEAASSSCVFVLMEFPGLQYASADLFELVASVSWLAGTRWRSRHSNPFWVVERLQLKFVRTSKLSSLCCNGMPPIQMPNLIRGAKFAYEFSRGLFYMAVAVTMS
jgi:hypothetical protein